VKKKSRLHPLKKKYISMHMHSNPFKITISRGAVQVRVVKMEHSAGRNALT
jgi:hypothetical protein